MKTTYLLVSTAIVLLFASCSKKGCTDSTATNFDSKATKNDGTCQYPVIVITIPEEEEVIVPLYDISENITVPTVLKAGITTICGTIKVTASLTIEPGAILVFCEDAALRIESNGSINAIGKADSVILFKGINASPGYWEGIAIFSNNPNNRLSYAVVQDAGSYWYWEYANLYLEGNARLAIDNSIIHNSNDIGLYADDAAQLPNFENNVFSSCKTGLNINAKLLGALDTASVFDLGNTNAYIYARSATITADVTVQKTKTPILVGGLFMEAGLTLNPGVTLLVEADGRIEVRSAGYLTAIGTATDSIIIHGRYSSAGYWSGLEFLSNNPNNKMSFVDIADGGGYWYYEYANIYLKNARLEIDNSTISNANSYGIQVKNSSLFTSGVTQTTAAGVEANNTFVNNGTGANAACTNGCTVLFE